MGSGVIYALIVVLWAAVLVPMWLRRHDEVTETRSVDRFQGAMRTLSRREAAAGDRREVLVPRRSATRAVPDGAYAQMSASSQAAVRRRRVVLGLAGLTVLLLVLAVAKVVPRWTALLPFVLLAAFMLWVSASARRARNAELAARRARASAVRRSRREAAQLAVATGQIDQMRAQVAAPRPGDVPFDQELSDRQRVAMVTAATPRARSDQRFYDAVAEQVWEPVPVPLPTYVLAPKAQRSVRVIDLTKPGSWTSGHLSEDELVEIDDRTGAPVGEPGGDAAPAARSAEDIVTGEVLVERLRAVGD